MVGLFSIGITAFCSSEKTSIRPFPHVTDTTRVTCSPGSLFHPEKLQTVAGTDPWVLSMTSYSSDRISENHQISTCLAHDIFFFFKAGKKVSKVRGKELSRISREFRSKAEICLLMEIQTKYPVFPKTDSAVWTFCTSSEPIGKLVCKFLCDRLLEME